MRSWLLCIAVGAAVAAMLLWAARPVGASMRETQRNAWAMSCSIEVVGVQRGSDGMWAKVDCTGRGLRVAKRRR